MQLSHPLFAILFLSAPLCAQTTWYVQPGASGNGSSGNPFGAVQDAIDAATHGDSIEVGPGTYMETINFLGKAIHAYGVAGADQTVIDGAGVWIVARFSSGEGPGTRLTGVTLANGAGNWVDQPGGGSPWLAGGGILCQQSSPTITDCVIRDGSTSVPIQDVARKGSGAYLLDASPQFVHCRFSGNRAVEDGGGVAIYGDSSPSFQDCEFISNRTWYQQPGEFGGGAFSDSTAAVLPVFEDCSFQSNRSGSGAGLAGRARVLDSLFRFNNGTLGGALHGVPEARNCELLDNRVGDAAAGPPEGGGAMASTLVDCLVRNNLAAGVGGGLSDCSATGCTLEGNVAIAGGGAHGSTLTDCLVIGNKADLDGGGLASCTASNCTVRSNEATRGAGAYNSNLDSCLVEQNVGNTWSSSVPSRGGGVRGGSATLCILTGNIADLGGAADSAILDRCSVGGNSARTSYGAVNVGTISNSVVWGNGSAPTSANITATYSCVEGSPMGIGNVAGEPATWATYGSVDMHLLPGSPCIDSADPGLPLDADGSPADMGALPFDPLHQGVPTTFCHDNKLHSAGCYAEIQATGTEMSIGGSNNLELEVHLMPSGKPTWLFWSTSVEFSPFLGGTLCLAPPLVRGTPTVSTGGNFCSGMMTSSLSAQDFVQAGIAPFTKIYVQGFFRDSAAPDGTGAGLSDAIEFVLLP